MTSSRSCSSFRFSITSWMLDRGTLEETSEAEAGEDEMALCALEMALFR